MPISDPRQVYFASQYSIDKIIGTFEGSFSAPGATGVVNVTTTSFGTSIPESTFFQGIYSVDNGDNWNRFNNDYGTDPISPDLDVYGYSTADVFVVTGRNNTFDSSSNFTVLYKVALIAKPDQGDITPQPIGSNIAFDSRENYLKIIEDEHTAISLGAGASTSYRVPHNLGRFPQAMSYLELSSGVGALPAGLYELDSVLKYLSADNVVNEGGAGATSSGLYLTTGDAVVKIKAGATAFAGELYVRVYSDD